MNVDFIIYNFGFKDDFPKPIEEHETFESVCHLHDDDFETDLFIDSSESVDAD